MVAVILSIITLGLPASLCPTINMIDETFESGMCLILIFSLVVVSMADVHIFTGITPGLFGYVIWAVFGSLALQVVFAPFFKIDSYILIIASTALVYSPPFVLIGAGALKIRKSLSGHYNGSYWLRSGKLSGFCHCQPAEVFLKPQPCLGIFIIGSCITWVSAVFDYKAVK